MLYMFLANGFEETEAIAPLDILRRCGIEIKTVGIAGRTVLGSHNIEITADIEKDEIDYNNMSGIILPGGMPGTKNLEKDEDVIRAAMHCTENGLLVAAICAAPMILGKLGILNGKRATCFPGFEEFLHGAALSAEYAVADGNVITAKGAGAALMFGAKIADYFKSGSGSKVLAEIQSPQQLTCE